MASALRLTPGSTIEARIRPPGSKSITNRALVCAALAEGSSRLKGVLDSEDTQVMMAAWQQLGLRIEHDSSRQEAFVEGCRGRLRNQEAEIFVGNSGTTIRFLTAALSACQGRFVLDGIPRMRERPIRDLIQALTNLGAEIHSLNPVNPDCPPLQVQGRGLRGGQTEIAGDVSSQFLSGLMLAAPLAEREVAVSVTGKLVSGPYVNMTQQVMEAFGAAVERVGNRIRIPAEGGYLGREYAIEPDASAASYFWAAAAISGGRGRVLGLNRNSLQGDVRFCEVLAQMGCRVEYAADSILVEGGELRGIHVNMGDISDTVQTLASVALFAEGATTIRGVAHNRVKETDRIADLAREIRKTGAEVEEYEDGLRITPAKSVQAAEFCTYEDHRMAMSLSLVGLRVPGVVIRDPACTAKTYPNYWQDLKAFSGCGIDWLNRT